METVRFYRHVWISAPPRFRLLLLDICGVSFLGGAAFLAAIEHLSH